MRLFKMQKSDIILVLVVILLVTQMGVIIYQHYSIKDLDNTVNYLDNAILSLTEEVGLTKEELKNKIEENYIQQQSTISKLTADVIKTQEDLEEQLDEIKNSVSSDFSEVIDDVIGAIVSIKTDVSQGSGFIVNEKGYVVTNVHVLSGANWVEVLPYQQSAKSAGLVGYNSEMDIALLKIEGNYDYLKFADSDDAEVGEKVIAMGNPYGLSFSVTEGIISSLNRKGPNGLAVYIQTDVPLNRGNSGGPLINKEGKVIGINNFKIGGAESLGFALESNSVVEAVNDLAEQKLNKEIV